MPQPPRFVPHDEHDELLVANVHPPDWKNPEPAGRYNLVVIGAGTAGLITAAVAAGPRRARSRWSSATCMGGDCLEHRLRALEERDPRGAPRRGGAPRAESSACPPSRATPSTSAPRWSACARSARASATRTRRCASATSSASTSTSARRASSRRDAVEVDGRRLRFAQAVIATGRARRAAADPGPRGGRLPHRTRRSSS